MKANYLWRCIMMAASSLVAFTFNAQVQPDYQDPAIIRKLPQKFERTPPKVRIMHPTKCRKLPDCDLSNEWCRRLFLMMGLDPAHPNPQTTETARHPADRWTADEVCREHGYRRADSWEAGESEGCHGFVYVVCEGFFETDQ